MKGKRFLLPLIAVFFMLVSLSECKVNEESAMNSDEETIMKYDEYNIETYLYPLWQGKYVYNETVMFVGKNSKAPLLYKAEEIVSVRSYDLKTEYVAGKDFKFDKKTNSLYLTANSAIPFISESEYYPEVKQGGNAFEFSGLKHKYIRFSEGSFFSALQIAVTYRHGGKNYISKPTCQSDAFSQVRKKISDGENVKILFYGDSITVGANASKFVNYPPYANTWTEMVFSALTKGNEKAEYVNTAVGGWSSQDGIDNLDERLLSHAPDAVFLAFGMNDVNLSPTEHIEKIKNMFYRIRERLPNCAVCLISTMLPNREVKGFYGYQPRFREKYYEFIDELRAEGETAVCYADVTKVHSEILERKRCFDMTGNNVNHPNDFLSRVYAQTVLQTVCDN